MSFFILAIQKGVSLITGKQFKPTVIISDAAPPIINAFYNQFESAESNVVCWAHVKRNLYQKVNNADILSDVDLLQLSPSVEVFETGVELFFIKWESSHKSFCKYFKKVWLQKNNSWFEGYQLLLPSHNNALEAKNNVIKKKYTLRRRLNIVKFNIQLFRFFTDMSSSYEEDLKYAVTSDIPCEAWTQAIVWAKDKKINYVIRESDLPNVQVVFVPSTDFLKQNDKKLESCDVDEFQCFQTDSFDDYYKNIFSIYKINFDNDNWKKSTCTCPHFLKMYYCKHVLGLSIRFKKSKPPAAANPIKLSEKRKRGRPKATKKALLMQ